MFGMYKMGLAHHSSIKIKMSFSILFYNSPTTISRNLGEQNNTKVLCLISFITKLNQLCNMPELRLGQYLLGFVIWLLVI